MAGNVEEFLIKLNQQVSGPAATAMGSLGQLEAKMKAAQGIAATMGGAMNRGGQMMAGGIASGVKGAAASIAFLGSTVKKVIDGDIRGALSGIGAVAEGAMGKLSAGLASLGPYGAAAASVLMVLTGGVSSLASALLDGMGAALGMAESSGKLHSTWAALAGGKAAGDKALASLDALAAKLPFSTGQIREWGQSLLAAGYHGKALEKATLAIAGAQATLGDGAASAMEEMLKGLNGGTKAAEKMVKDLQAGGTKSSKALRAMGLSTGDLAKAAGMTEKQFAKAKLSAADMARFAEKAMAGKAKDPLAAMMGTWPVILMKAKAGFMSLFAKIPGIPAFMAAVKSLFGQFNKGQPIIRSLQKVFSEVFGTLFKYATMAVKAISAFIKENVNAKSIGKVWAGIKSFIAAVAKVLAPVIAHFKNAAKSGMLMKGVSTAIKIVGAVILFVVGIIGEFANQVLTGVESLGMLASAFDSVNFSGIGSAISGFVTGAISTLAGLASGAVDAAGGFISGLLSGIQAGAGAIVAAVKGIAGAALGAFTGALGIHSPSVVMTQMGGHFSAGVEEGIDGGSDDVAASAKKMGGAAAGGAAAGMGSVKAGNGKSGGGLITYNNCIFGEVSQETYEAWTISAFDKWAKGGAEPVTVSVP